MDSEGNEKVGGGVRTWASCINQSREKEKEVVKEEDEEEDEKEDEKEDEEGYEGFPVEHSRRIINIPHRPCAILIT